MTDTFKKSAKNRVRVQLKKIMIFETKDRFPQISAWVPLRCVPKIMIFLIEPDFCGFFENVGHRRLQKTVT